MVRNEPLMAGNQEKYSIESELQGLINDTMNISCAVERETDVRHPWNKSRYDFTYNEASPSKFCVKLGSSNCECSLNLILS